MKTNNFKRMLSSIMDENIQNILSSVKNLIGYTSAQWDEVISDMIDGISIYMISEIDVQAIKNSWTEIKEQAQKAPELKEFCWNSPSSFLETFGEFLLTAVGDKLPKSSQALKDLFKILENEFE